MGGLLSSERRERGGEGGGRERKTERERQREESRRTKEPLTVAPIRIFTGVIRYEPHNTRNDAVRCQRNSRGNERSSTNVHACGNGPWASLISPGVGES